MRGVLGPAVDAATTRSSRARTVPRAADPVAVAAQHVLRHLHDPVALARNPLVVSLLQHPDGMTKTGGDAATRVQALVRSCADAIRTQSGGAAERRERQYQILVRCDIDRESHEIVARDLGLSRRQFYRERNAAARSLAQFLVSRSRPLPASVSIDRFGLELSRAKALRLAGEAQRSESILAELVASSEEIARKVEPWCALVDILINCNRIEEGERALCEAEAVLQQGNGVSKDVRAALRARIDMQRASYLWFQGRIKEATEIDERTAPVVAKMAQSANTDAHEFYVSTRLRQVQCQLMSGTIQQAKADIRDIGEFLARVESVPLSQRIAFLIASGYVTDHATDPSSDTSSVLRDALELAQRHGLIELVIEAMCQLSSHAQLRGDHAAGMRYIYDVLPIAERFALPSQHGMLLNVAAISEASLGHHETAVTLARRALDVLAPSSLESIYSRLAEAQASVTTRAFSAGRSAAMVAYDAARRIGSDRLAGTALRLMAESAAGLGGREEARAFALGAVACLEREGPPFALLQAYRVAARIAGDRRLRGRAAELSAALQR